MALILCAVVLLTAAQIIIKARLTDHGPIPLSAMAALDYLLAAVRDWRLMGGFLILVVAAFGWYAGLSRVPLSIAFPVAALTYPLVYLSAIVVLREAFSWAGLTGCILIVGGILLIHSSQ